MLLPQSVIRITLDVREVEKQLSFAIKQNDSARRLIVTLCDMGKPYVIGRGCYAVFSATTSANTTISNGCQIKNNEIIYDLSASDTAVVGRMDCDITLFGENGEVIAAPNFTINVYKSKMGEYAGEVVASDDFSTLQGLIGDANERIAKVDAILESDGKTIDEAIEAGIAALDNHAEQQFLAIEQKGAETLATIPDDYTETYNTTIKHTAEIDILKSKVSINSKRLANLEAGIPEEDFVEDSDVAYIKDVPTNALPYAEIVKIGGMTRTCGNLFDVSKAQLQYRCNTDGSLVKNGSYATSDYIEVKGGTSYYLTNVCGNNYVSAVLFDASKAVVSYANLGAGGKVSGVLNVDSNVKYIRINIFTDTVDVNAVMVNEGTEPLPYEPYFSGLRSAPVTEVESVGANLTTAQEVYKGANAYAEMVVDGRNCVVFNSRETKKNYPIKFKENTRYTVSFYKKSENRDGATANNISFTFWYSDGTQSSSFADRNDTSWTKTTFTSDEGKTVVAVGVGVMEYRAYVYLDIDTFMFNEGSTALPYRPYTKNTLAIPEAVRPKNGINENVYDYIDFEKKQSDQRVGVAVFDGSTDEQWMDTSALNTADYNAFYTRQYATNGHKLYAGKALCDKLSLLTYGELTGANVGGFFMGDATDKQIIIRVPNSITTTTELRVWLAENPLTVYYELATPIITDISDKLPADNLIAVEGAGTLTFKNEFGYAVPSEVKYYINAASGVLVDGSPALKVGDAIITEAQLKALLALV